jgi:hypothetical protein
MGGVMHRADDLSCDDNWHGGYYELAINLGPRNDARLEQALAALWRAAGVEGCLARDASRQHRPVNLCLASIEKSSHLAGVTTLPDHRRMVCGAVAIREEAATHGNDWLDFYLPLGALGRHDVRVGSFPFGSDGGAISQSWREPLHQWFSHIGKQTFKAAPFLYAAIGWEVSGMSLEDVLRTDGRNYHVLVARGVDLEILPVTRWDFGMPV